MNVSLESVVLRRNGWQLACEGVFGEGIHLVSGRIGSGKSTLSLALIRMLKPFQGSVAYHEVNTAMLSMQFPEYHVTGRTIAEEIRSWALSPAEIIKRVGLQGMEHESPLALSRGELKRLHLTCVLAREWDLLILDEPFAALDCVQKAAISAQIEARTRGITVLLTHEQAYLPRVHRIWELREGALADCGEVPEAFRCWTNAPPHLRHAIARGAMPENVTLLDTLEALCRIRD
jgi:energy-coupling factor transport system ATP-binding protein